MTLPLDLQGNGKVLSGAAASAPNPSPLFLKLTLSPEGRAAKGPVGEPCGSPWVSILPTVCAVLALLRAGPAAALVLLVTSV